MPWHADLHVSFTDDPAAATVRVQISDSAEAADFAVVDDVDNPEDRRSGDGVRAATAATLSVAVSASRSGSAPVIYLSKEALPITGFSCGRRHSRRAMRQP